MREKRIHLNITHIILPMSSRLNYTTCKVRKGNGSTFLRNNNINHRIEFDVNISTVDSRAPDVEALDRGYVA